MLSNIIKRAMNVITPAHISAYQRDGAIHIPNLLNCVNHEHRRRVFSVRFLGDDIRHAPRQWATSPDFPGLSEILAAGATMDHPFFPMV